MKTANVPPEELCFTPYYGHHTILSLERTYHHFQGKNRNAGQWIHHDFMPVFQQLGGGFQRMAPHTGVGHYAQRYRAAGGADKAQYLCVRSIGAPLRGKRKEGWSMIMFRVFQG